MSTDIATYIKKGKPWQAEVCQAFRDMVLKTVPAAEESFEYGKPHFLKDGHYLASIYMAKNKITLVLFDVNAVVEVKGMVRAVGDGSRKAVDITEGQKVDYEFLASLLRQITDTL